MIYFDNNATTRVAPEVVEAMLPFLRERWGNPSSAYRFGRDQGKAMEAARERVANLVGAAPKEVVFTSCGTESNNAAWQSALRTQPSRRHILTTSVEHSANIQFGRALQERGYEVTYLPVEPDGSLDLHLLEKSIRPDTALVSVMWANNETGVIFPVAEISAICRSRGVWFHTDAVQVPGKLPIDVHALDVDFLSLSAHKLHAPKGIGCLFVRLGRPFEPFVVGGSQEGGRRGGTENVPYIVGFGRAAELALESIAEENTRVRRMRDLLERGILSSVPGASRNGAKEPRLPNTTNIAFENVEAEAILMQMDQKDVCVSSGSACTTGSIKPSHVLTSMGVRPRRSKGSIRFSLGVYNTQEEVNEVLSLLPGVIRILRENQPGGEEFVGESEWDHEKTKEQMASPRTVGRAMR